MYGPRGSGAELGAILVSYIKTYFTGILPEAWLCGFSNRARGRGDMQALKGWLQETFDGHPFGCIAVCDGALLGEWFGGGFDADVRFEIGSLRKSFCCALVGIGVGRGDFGYDIKGQEVWPEFIRMSGDPADGEITLHDLLSASSGWLTSAPRGTEFRYNNAAFTATERVIGRFYGAADDEIASLVEAAFKNPLGAHSWTVHHMRDRVFDPRDIDATGPKLAIDSTLRDLVRWGELWAGGGEWGGRRLIPADHVARATHRANPHIPNAHYGYNWFVNDGGALWPGAPHESFGHIGLGSFNESGKAGYTCLWMWPERRVAAALAAPRVLGLARDHLSIPQGLTANWIRKMTEECTP